MLTDKFTAGLCTLKCQTSSLPVTYESPDCASLPLFPLSSPSNTVHLLYTPGEAVSPCHGTENAECPSTQKSFLPDLSDGGVSPQSERLYFTHKTLTHFLVFIFFAELV